MDYLLLDLKVKQNINLLRRNNFMMVIHFNLFVFFQIESLDDLENEVDEVLHKLEKKWTRTLLHTVAFY